MLAASGGGGSARSTHRALGDAEQRVMRLVHLGIGEIDVVGGDQRQIVAYRRARSAPPRCGPRRQAVALQLDIEPAGKERGEPQQHRLGRRRLAFGEQPSDRPAGPPVRQISPSVMPFERGERRPAAPRRRRSRGRLG